MCAIFLRVAFCHSQNEDLWFLCSFLFRLFFAHERKERAADVSPVRTLSFTLFEWLLAWSLLRVGRECPVYLFIGQGAVNASAHHQTTILQNFLLCILFAIGKDFKHTLKNILRSYSVNPFLLHISKTLLLIICTPLAHHSITYDVLTKSDVYHIHRQRTCRVPFLLQSYGLHLSILPCW